MTQSTYIGNRISRPPTLLRTIPFIEKQRIATKWDPWNNQNTCCELCSHSCVLSGWQETWSGNSLWRSSNRRSAHIVWILTTFYPTKSLGSIAQRTRRWTQAILPHDGFFWGLGVSKSPKAKVDDLLARGSHQLCEQNTDTVCATMEVLECGAEKNCTTKLGQFQVCLNWAQQVATTWSVADYQKAIEQLEREIHQ